MKFEVMMRHVVSVAGSAIVPGIVVSSMIFLGGCGGSGGSGGGTTSPPPPPTSPLGGATDVYVISNSASGVSDSILDFATSSTGSVSPKGTLSVQSGFAVGSVTTDSTGQIYIGVYVPGASPAVDEVLVYAAGASGDATPVRTISIVNDPLGDVIQPVAMAVDSSGNLFVLGTGNPSLGVGNFAEFSSTASGSSGPDRFVKSASLLNATGIAVDASDNIYVSTANADAAGTAETGTIAVFGSSEVGVVTPVRSITTTGGAFGVALDSGGSIHALVDAETFDNTGAITSIATEVDTFAGGVSGSSTATSTLAGAATTLSFGAAVQLDTLGNVYVLNGVTPTGGGTEMYSVLGFAASASGNTAPAINFSSAEFTNPGLQIAVH